MVAATIIIIVTLIAICIIACMYFEYAEKKNFWGQTSSCIDSKIIKSITSNQEELYDKMGELYRKLGEVNSGLQRMYETLNDINNKIDNYENRNSKYTTG